MLDRASTCLESGGRQLLRAPRKCIRSRRMLHAYFWHNAACDVGASAWWTAPLADAVPMAPSDNPRNASYIVKGQPDRILLDFLYPAKALAYMRRLTAYDWNVTDHRRKSQLSSGGVRGFSSTTGHRVPVEVIETEEVRADVQQRLLKDSPFDALRKLLNSQEKGKEDVAWQLYTLLQENERTPALCAGLLDYFDRREAGSHDANPILQIFRKIPVQSHKPSSYRMAISAYADLGMVGPAVKLHDEAARTCSAADFGSSILLCRLIRDKQWELMLRVFGSFLQSQGLEKISKRHSFWRRVSQIPDLPDVVASLLDYIRQYGPVLQSESDKRKILVAFLDVFVSKIMVNAMFDVDEPNEQLVSDLFQEFRNQGLIRPKHYEAAIFEMLLLPRYREYLNQHKFFLDLYTRFKQDSLNSTDPSFHPSRKLLDRLIFHVGHHGSLKETMPGTATVAEFVKDWRHWHGPLSQKLLNTLLVIYSRAGDADMVQEYLDELLALPDTLVTTEHLNRLIYAYAKRIDVDAAVYHFNRISKEFGLKPDVASWNIVLHAYVRADDLDGALSWLASLLEAGLDPDKYTFGPLLHLCARRGDVDSVQSLLDQADIAGVSLRTQVTARASLVTAHLKAYDTAGAERAAQEILKQHRVGAVVGSLAPIWNMLIMQYAVEGDVDSSRRIFRQMGENDIPSDSWTYAALMRSLIQIKQTNAAYKILRVAMPANHIRAYAFHYALVMTGFVRERQLDRARHAYQRMLARKIKPSFASRMASLQVVGFTELQKLKEKQDRDPMARLVEIEELMRDILAQSDASELADPGRLSSHYNDPPNSLIPEGYFGFLILLYGARGALSVCKELFDAAISRIDERKSYEAPLGLLVALMTTHWRAKEYDEVEKCWRLAQAQADKITKSLQHAMGTAVPATKVSNLFDPSTLPTVSAATIAMNRRHILATPAKVYLRSLFEQNRAGSVQKAQETFSSLLARGYTFDSITWNEFIQLLARSGRMLDAFTACEAYLMPNFFGWRKKASPPLPRGDPRGLQYMVPPKDVDRRVATIPRYKTMVIMAAAYTYVKRREAIGIHSNPATGEPWSTEMLRTVAPKTIHAIEAMPVIPDDPIQKKYLDSM